MFNGSRNQFQMYFFYLKKKSQYSFEQDGIERRKVLRNEHLSFFNQLAQFLAMQRASLRETKIQFVFAVYAFVFLDVYIEDSYMTRQVNNLPDAILCK